MRHFCIVTNRSDPEGSSGLDLIRWHRGKAGAIEHAHDVLMNELAGAALPSQKFGANAAWLHLNVILYNRLSAYKHVGLPEEFHAAQPKRLRFLRGDRRHWPRPRPLPRVNLARSAIRLLADPRKTARSPFAKPSVEGALPEARVDYDDVFQASRETCSGEASIRPRISPPLE